MTHLGAIGGLECQIQLIEHDLAIVFDDINQMNGSSRFDAS